MRDKLIPCLLSLTLIVSSFVPFGVAFGDPTEEPLEELPSEQVVEPLEVVSDEPLEVVVDETVADKVQRLKDLAFELGDDPALYPDLSLPEELSKENETELSVPVEEDESDLSVAVEEDESFYQPAVLSDDYGIATASWSDAEFEKIDDILTWVKSLFNTSNQIFNFVSDTLDNIKAIYQAIIGAYVPSADYAVGSMAYYIKYSYYMLLELGVYTDSLEGTLSSVYSRLSHTASTDGGSYSVARSAYWCFYYLYYHVAPDLDNMLSLLSFTKADGSETYSVARSAYWCFNYLYYHVAPDLDNMQEQLDSLIDLFANLEIKVPEVNVDVDVLTESSDSADLWAALFGALEFAMIASSIDDLGDTLETTFPFSLVAGFVAILGLLQADPVAPSFDFPLPDGSGGSFVYTVDLSPFDPVAEVFRALITLLFCVGLIFITRNFIFKGGSQE